jgi:hypothetical protein
MFKLHTDLEICFSGGELYFGIVLKDLYCLEKNENVEDGGGRNRFRCPTTRKHVIAPLTLRARWLCRRQPCGTLDNWLISQIFFFFTFVATDRHNY